MRFKNSGNCNPLIVNQLQRRAESWWPQACDSTVPGETIPQAVVRKMRKPAEAAHGRHDGQAVLPGQVGAKAATGRSLIQIRISEQSRGLPSDGICLHCGGRLEKPQGIISKRSEVEP